jgi:hypothetical protein
MADRNALLVLGYMDQPGGNQRQIDIEPWRKAGNGIVIISVMLRRAHRDLVEPYSVVHPCGPNSGTYHRSVFPTHRLQGKRGEAAFKAEPYTTRPGRRAQQPRRIHLK